MNQLIKNKLKVKLIKKSLADSIIKKYHYSGKVVANSKLNFGVYYDDILEGAIQYGSPLDKKKVIQYVGNSGWNSFFEINRMAFSDKLPRNSESRALSISMKMIKKNYPFVKWILTFADATSCGDGTIYRACGFLLVGINKNKTIYEMPDGYLISNIAMRKSPGFQKKYLGRVFYGQSEAESFAKKEKGAVLKKGFQIRYIKFLDDNFKSNLNLDILDYSQLEKMNARMYRGEAILDYIKQKRGL